VFYTIKNVCLYRNTKVFEIMGRGKAILIYPFLNSFIIAGSAIFLIGLLVLQIPPVKQLGKDSQQ